LTFLTFLALGFLWRWTWGVVFGSGLGEKRRLPGAFGPKRLPPFLPMVLNF
jgi:hypothetical protein